MELLKVDNDSFGNLKIAECLNKWNLLAFREGEAETSPIILAYSGAADDVLSHWTQVAHDIALHVQAELPVHNRRNLSLAFITSSLPREAIREIRDDTYCCKKIVLEATVANALQELERYYLGNHNNSSFKVDDEKIDELISRPLSSYIFEKHPEVKKLMSTKP